MLGINAPTETTARPLRTRSRRLIEAMGSSPNSISLLTAPSFPARASGKVVLGHRQGEVERPAVALGQPLPARQIARGAGVVEQNLALGRADLTVEKQVGEMIDNLGRALNPRGRHRDVEGARAA